MRGLLTGLRVVELASEHAAFAGKVMGDLGADVVVVEPPGGHHTRTFGPYAEEVEAPENSLWWWFYNANKRGVTIDLVHEPQRFADLCATADIVLEGEAPGTLRSLGLDYEDLRPMHPGLIWVSVTLHGRSAASLPFVDLTVSAGAGPMWSSGYDDHSLPPVRPGVGQTFHTGSIWAVMGALTALAHRDVTEVGQIVDVSLIAASNVSTESGSFRWLLSGETVQRQTNRHAYPLSTSPTTTIAADGREVQTGVPPRTAAEFAALLAWLDEVGVRDELPEAFFLEMGAARDLVDHGLIGVDPEVTAIVSTARDAIDLIASRTTAYDFFLGGQRHGLTCGIIYSPEEAMADPHAAAIGFPTPVFHDLLGRDVVYPGPPFDSTATAWSMRRRAPMVGEHNGEILDRPLA